MSIAIKQPGDKKSEKAIPPFHTADSTISKYLLDRLLTLGVKHIFGVPGDYILKLNKRIEEHEMAFINTTREHTAGYMADAYARLQGLAAVCITYGVGISVANAIAQAYVESCPVVVISGSVSHDEFAKCPHLHHLINTSSSTRRDRTQMEIFKQITVAQAVLNDPVTAAAEIDQVIETCLREQKPVYIEIPRNMVDSEIPEHHYIPTPTKKSDPDELLEATAKIGKVIEQSKRPFIWLGHEVQRHNLRQQLLAFAEKFHIPIVSTLLGKTAISERHPLYSGIYIGEISRPEVREFVEGCDCAIHCGVVLNDVNTGLLSAKIDHDHRVILNETTVAVDNRTYEKVVWKEALKSLAKIDSNKRFKINYPANIDRQPPVFSASKTKPLTATSLYNAIEKNLSHDHILIADIGDVLFGTADYTLEQDCYLSSAYYATVGFAIPAAIAAQIYSPKKRVIAVVGDGAFQMTGTELSTALRFGADPIVIVVNNHGYSMERPIVEGTFNDIVNWNYSKVTELLGGGKGILATTEDEFAEALTQALGERGTPYIIEVSLDKSDISPGMARFADIINRKTATTEPGKGSTHAT
ncbi:MAG: alpha-keto acid decarboxylase family protein [Chlamydiales bacterium]|nr:alpha-keto acid decarboxylase family protein [Chlamydiia bacterium]MCP5507706.1 alpha-keto acid decarboxylase family protein [Chlamydiales bacterium]